MSGSKIGTGKLEFVELFEADSTSKSLASVRNKESRVGKINVCKKKSYCFPGFLNNKECFFLN